MLYVHVLCLLIEIIAGLNEKLQKKSKYTELTLTIFIYYYY